MRIDRSDPVDGPPDAHTTPFADSAPDDSRAAGKDEGTAVKGDDAPDSSPACADSALRTERAAAYFEAVAAVYRRRAVDHDHGQVGRDGRMPGRIVSDDAGRESNMVTGSHDSHSAYHADEGVRALAQNGWDGGDVPDDPRNYSNPKTGRFDASWSTYDRALAAARARTGGNLGPDSIKMYDYSPETAEGTGTLIGEQTPDRLRGWRIDGQDGHVNWWNWTEGKKGAGGFYGHDWFPADPSTPGSRYIGWAPWLDIDGNIREGN